MFRPNARLRPFLTVLLGLCLISTALLSGCDLMSGTEVSVSVSIPLPPSSESGSDAPSLPDGSSADEQPVSVPESDEPSVADPLSEAESSEETVPEEGTVLYRTLSLPDSSETRSDKLASQLLGFCSLGSENVARYLMESAGFEAVLTSGFDKSPTDASHTCAFIVGKGTLLYRGSLRTLFLIIVRGTQDAEWLSNFDFAPSEDEHTMYAENFLACAEDVMTKTEPLLKAEDDPLIAVCGHSRGAACANLAGVLLNRDFPSANTFVYTFATPTTVREQEGFDNSPHRNIFNYLNPCDIVTKVPLEGWGFSRAGTDILLDADEKEIRRVSDSTDALLPIAPTIRDYYHTRHALTPSGKDEDGLTTYEVMKLLTGTFGNPTVSLSGPLASVDKSSVYYPVVSFFTGKTEGGGLSLSVLLQHMPATYLLKIQALVSANG